jgi:hypothetical protein
VERMMDFASSRLNMSCLNLNVNIMMKKPTNYTTKANPYKSIFLSKTASHGYSITEKRRESDITSSPVGL